jgi:hypothetical protein
MRRGRLLAALLPVLAVLATPSAPLAAAGDLAQGSGTLVPTTHCFGTSAVFEFTATGLAGDMNPATGTFSFTCATGAAFSGTVSCLVVDGNIATVGGTVTTSTHSGFPENTGFSFTVQDVGPAGSGDRFSSFSSSAMCPFDDPVRPLLAGDIVVGHVVEPPPQSTPATVVLSPAMAINDVGTTHTVTATATTAGGAPSVAYTVFFRVTGSVSATGSCTTDMQGRCSFTYAGPPFPGTDAIRGCVDADKNGVAEDPGEPCGNAVKVWMLPATTPGEVTGGGWIAKGGGKVSFGLIADSEGVGSTPEGHCNVIDHAAKLHINCLSVDALVVTPTHATFFGRATVGGVATHYRIDVDDLGEPGTNDTFKILTDTGYVAAGTLQGGNIQICIE